MSQWKCITGVFFKEVFPQNALKAGPLNTGKKPVSVSSLSPTNVKSSGPGDKDPASETSPKVPMFRQSELPEYGKN